MHISYVRSGTTHRAYSGTSRSGGQAHDGESYAISGEPVLQVCSSAGRRAIASTSSIVSVSTKTIVSRTSSGSSSKWRSLRLGKITVARPARWAARAFIGLLSCPGSPSGDVFMPADRSRKNLFWDQRQIEFALEAHCNLGSFQTSSRL